MFCQHLQVGISNLPDSRNFKIWQQIWMSVCAWVFHPDVHLEDVTLITLIGTESTLDSPLPLKKKSENSESWAFLWLGSTMMIGQMILSVLW
jgi:hypothetical protein